tara:strand:+ start:631 stop:1200 length:570 start_codon:yes stop_codon:yes gene_type:complete
MVEPFTVQYKPMGIRKISPTSETTKGSTEVIITLNPTVVDITKFDIERRDVPAGPVTKTIIFEGDYKAGFTYNFLDDTAVIGQEYTYSVKAPIQLPFFTSPTVTLTIPCSTVCCPNKFPFGRWNNTSTNLKLFPSLLKNQKYYGNNSGTLPVFINPPRVNNNIFTNTSYQMKKSELFKYLSTNRAYLRR